MLLELPLTDLNALVARQLRSLFTFDEAVEAEHLAAGMDAALARCEYCFAQTSNKYFRRGEEVYFNPFHSGQYCIFLYYLARAVHLAHPESTLADRLYYLNKSLNSVDLLYDVVLPDAFYVEHPLGSVMGRAVYGERFIFYQQCTVGGSGGCYPVLGEHVVLFAGAKVLGRSRVHENVVLAANACVLNEDVPANSLVFGVSPHLVIKPRPAKFAQDFY